MGLVERRAIKHFEEETYPPLKRRVDAAAFFEVPMEIDWNSLAVETYANLYEEAIPKVFFEPLINAFEGITVDQMGRDALKEGLKKVVIHCTSDKYTLDTDTIFKDGILTLDLHPVTNIENVEERTKEIQTALEQRL